MDYLLYHKHQKYKKEPEYHSFLHGKHPWGQDHLHNKINKTNFINEM